MPPPAPIHAVYSEQLLPAGHGYPLWDAELEDQKFEVEVGTVGRMDSGKFWLLFNATKPADDPYQKYGVPSKFEVFTPRNVVKQGPWPRIKWPLVTSKTVVKHEISANASGGVPSLESICSAGAGFKFVSTKDSGAFLLLEPPAMAYRWAAKRHFVRYMRDNFDDWLAFANEERGMMLSQDQIFFVHGWVKTSRWACGAYQGNCRNREGSLQAQILNVGNIDVSISFSSESAARTEYNFGPTTSDDRLSGSVSRLSISSASAEGSGSQESAEPKRDQCIFINYFKAKRRLFRWGREIIEAAAGPHQLPPGDRDNLGPNDPVAAGHGGDSSGNSSDFEEMPAPEVVSASRISLVTLNT
ncbi:hypothetical protein OH77DRAFT_1071100 [Trametes cingulata]|nr:hypothetical protein OH77DRAFT_1071100 [Trametes cingulata]